MASSDEAPSPARQPLYYEAVLRLRPDLVLSTPFDWPCQLERARRRNGTIFAVGDYLAFGAAGVMAATALAARSSKHVEPLQNLKNVVWSHTNATGMEETGTGAATGGVARLCASCDRRTIDSQEDCALPVGACLVRSSPAAVNATTSAATMITSSGTAENGRNDTSRLCYSVVCESAGFHYPDDKPGIDGATRSKKGAHGYNLTSGPGPQLLCARQRPPRGCDTTRRAATSCTICRSAPTSISTSDLPGSAAIEFGDAPMSYSSCATKPFVVHASGPRAL